MSHAVKFPEIGGGIWDKIDEVDTSDQEALLRRAKYEKDWELRKRLSSHSEYCESTGATIDEIVAFHSELLNIDGDRDEIYALLRRYRLEKPSVLISVIYRNGFTIFKNNYDNRKIRIALAGGLPLG